MASNFPSPSLARVRSSILGLIFAACCHSAFAVIVTGTGFFVSDDGLLVTNFHVIENARSVEVWNSGTNSRVRARVVRVDRQNDLALLQIDRRTTPVMLAASSSIRRGERVYALGFPQVAIQGVEPKLTDGVVSSLAGIRDEPTTFQISNPIQPGNSGGPLFLDDGRVVGVIVASLNASRLFAQHGVLPQNVNYAIKSNYVVELIRSLRPAFQIAEARARGRIYDIPETVARLEQSIALIVADIGDAPTGSQAGTASLPGGRDSRPLRPGGNTIRIAHVGPISGAIAHLGKDNENGARLAVEELNAKGVTIGGKRMMIELITEDDAADPRQGRAVAQKLVDAKVHGVIGHLNSGTSIPASKLYSDAGIPQISPSSTNPKYTRQGFKTTFRVVADDARLGSILGKYAVYTLRTKTVAVIDDRTAYGAGVADSFIKGVEAAGGTVVAREFTTDRATDFEGILSTIKYQRPDLVFFGGMDAVAGPMLLQMKLLGIETRFMGGDGICSSGLVNLARGTMSDDQVVCAEAGGVERPLQAGMENFSRKFKAKFNADVQVYAPYVYDALNVMVAAMVKAGSAEPAEYLPVLAKIEYKGVTGPITFDEIGDIRNGALTLYTYRGGKRVQVAVVR